MLYERTLVEFSTPSICVDLNLNRFNLGKWRSIKNFGILHGFCRSIFPASVALVFTYMLIHVAAGQSFSSNVFLPFDNMRDLYVECFPVSRRRTEISSTRTSAFLAYV